jgi:hypothetical protein
MPKATAVWLVDNTALTFDQIAEFCGLHQLEVQGIADGEVASSMQGIDPVANGELTQAEIERCQKNPSARLRAAKLDLPQPTERTKGPKYTPIAKRQDKPDGIAWIVRNHPEIKDAAICKLIGTTKNTIQSIRERTHWNIQNIKPVDPVLLGLCKQGELNEAIRQAKAQRARENPGATGDDPAEAPAGDNTAEAAPFGADTGPSGSLA